jgi:hypothetical protein
MDDSQEITEVVEVKGVYGFMESMLAGRIEDATEEEYRICLDIPDKKNKGAVDGHFRFNYICRLCHCDRCSCGCLGTGFISQDERLMKYVLYE